MATKKKVGDIWNHKNWGGITLFFAILFFLGALLIPILAFTGDSVVDPKGPAGFVAGIGMPSFLLGHLSAIIALASDKHHSRKLARRSLIVLWGTMEIGLVLILIFRDK